MLEIKNLNYQYPNSDFKLTNINLTFSENKIYTILGKNGSGKTTLLNLILGLIKQPINTLFYNGIDLKVLKQKEKAHIMAYVPQASGASYLTAYETIMLGRSSYFLINPTKNDKLIVEKTIEELNLTKFKNKKVSQLSGGEAQLVSIARCLAQMSDIIIFDEPTSSLDITNEMVILNLAKELATKFNKKIIISIHDLNLALKYSDYFILLKEGNIIKQSEEINEVDLKNTFDLDLEIKQIENEKIIILK